MKLFGGKAVAIGLTCLVLGGILGTSLHAYYDSNRDSLSLIRLKDKNYPLINPLIGFDNDHPTNDSHISRIEDAIKAAAQNHLTPDIRKISVYFRDLNTGRWVGYNDTVKFAPASLMKVVTLIAYFKEADTNPSIMNDKLYYDGTEDRNASEHYRPQESLEPGYHTVQELLERMIIVSGNNSNLLLITHLGQDKIARVYEDLDIPLPVSTTEFDFLTAHDYSFLFRALYNATYLSRASSEKALELLTRAEFAKGLRPGVPEGVHIAHKFGERTMNASVVGESEGYIRELHDCGIIYDDQNPYFLCVMTQGKEFEKLELVIQDISKATYEAAIGKP